MPKIITSLFLIAKTKASRSINFTFSPPIIELLLLYSNSRSLLCSHIANRNPKYHSHPVFNIKPFRFHFHWNPANIGGQKWKLHFRRSSPNLCCHSPISRFWMVLETKFGNMWHLPDWFFRGWGLSVDHRRRLQRGCKGCRGIVCNGGMSHHCTRWLAWHSYYWSDAAVLLSNAFGLTTSRRDVKVSN